MEKKEFNRSVCFTFFEDYRKTAREIEEDFGKAAVADYYNAIIDYALYGEEPELKGALKYVWHTTKTSIDKSIERRSSGFRENKEKTEEIRKYKEENPKATQREIAEATGASLGKVNKALKSDSYSNTDSYTSSSSYTIDEREHEQDSLSQEKEKKEEKKEETIEDVLKEKTDVELKELLSRFRKQERYNSLQKDFNLPYGSVTENLGKQIDGVLKDRQREVNKKRQIEGAYIPECGKEMSFEERFKLKKQKETMTNKGA